MSDPTFEEMVELVRELYIDDDLTSPAESLKDFYPSTVGELRANLLAGLIERSEDSKLEWDAVALIAQQALRSGERLPQALADWVADVLAGDRPRPTKPGSTGGVGGSGPEMRGSASLTWENGRG